MNLSIEDTKLLYLSVYFFTTLFAYLSQKKADNRIVFRKYWLIAAFLIHWIVESFTTTGVDYYHYYRDIEMLDSSVFYDVEPMFNGLGYLLNLVFKNPHIAIFFIKTLAVSILYYSLYRIRCKANLGIAVLAYNSLVFIQSMLVIAQHLALVIWFCALVILLEKKYIISLALALCSCLIHSSFWIIIFMYPICIFYEHREKRIGALTILLGLISILLIRYSFVSILLYGINNFAFFNHYANYDVLSNEVIGVGQLIFFIPIIYYDWRQYTSGDHINVTNISIIHTAFAIMCAIIGYFIEVFSRMNIEFYGLYALLIPMYIGSLDVSRLKKHYFIWVGYLIFRGYFVFNTNMDPNASGEMYNYMFFNPFA